MNIIFSVPYPLTFHNIGNEFVYKQVEKFKLHPAQPTILLQMICRTWEKSDVEHMELLIK